MLFPKQAKHGGLELPDGVHVQVELLYRGSQQVQQTLGDGILAR